MHRWILIWLLFQIVSIHANSQALCVNFKENLLKGRVKQIDEFMSRFNMEEGWDGKKLTDKSDFEFRKKYIKTLFDYDKFRNSKGTFAPIVEKFAKTVVENEYTIHYEDSTWTALVKCSTTLCGKNEMMTLFLQTRQLSKNEYVWVIKDVTGRIFSSVSEKSASEKQHLFISPMEHEIGFIGILDKPYKGADMSKMIAKDYTTSRLLMFTMLMESGLLKLNAIQNVSFLFKPIPGWSFVVNRIEKKNSYNTGWLITEITNTTQNK